MPGAREAGSRNFALDVLRGVAIALVLVHHMAISERAAGEGVGSMFQQVALADAPRPRPQTPDAAAEAESVRAIELR